MNKIVDEFDMPSIVFVITQYYADLYKQIENLNTSKNKVFTNLIWCKLFKKYHKQIIKKYDKQTIKESVLYITKYFITDKEVVDTLQDNQIF